MEFNMAFIIKTCYGFCPTQGIAYSVEVKYIIVDINTYRKESKDTSRSIKGIVPETKLVRFSGMHQIFLNHK